MRRDETFCLYVDTHRRESDQKNADKRLFTVSTTASSWPGHQITVHSMRRPSVQSLCLIPRGQGGNHVVRHQNRIHRTPGYDKNTRRWREREGEREQEKHKCRTFQSFTFVHNSENTGGETGGSSFCSLPLPAPISILFRSARIGIRIGV
jgi:hypothetical protein